MTFTVSVCKLGVAIPVFIGRCPVSVVAMEGAALEPAFRMSGIVGPRHASRGCLALFAAMVCAGRVHGGYVVFPETHPAIFAALRWGC